MFKFIKKVINEIKSVDLGNLFDDERSVYHKRYENDCLNGNPLGVWDDDIYYEAPRNGSFGFKKADSCLPIEVCSYYRTIGGFTVKIIGKRENGIDSQFDALITGNTGKRAEYNGRPFYYDYLGAVSPNPSKYPFTSEHPLVLPKKLKPLKVKPNV